MIIAKRATVSALTLAAAVALLPMAPANAGHDCKSDKEAEATVLGVGPHAVRRANRAAIHAWKHEVAAEHGWAYARWSHAQEKRGKCHVKKGGRTECEVEAKPCR